jgi:YidC/Oxa1 family membrane protein insertase
MFDPFLRAVAQALAALYELPVVGGSYGEAIILLTLIVMVLLMPLTLKATRSTIKMTQVQPELKRLQKKYKDDRETLNQEMMKLYQEQGINPVGGCLPMLAQLPVFLVLFQVLRGLSRRISDQPFFEAANLVRQRAGLSIAEGNEISPRFISEDTEMYQNLAGQTEMGFGPFDLAAEARDVLSDSIPRGIPYVLLIIVVVGTSYYQQRQVSARRTPGAPSMNPQQQMLLRILPLLSGFWSFLFPAGLVLYWATSNTFRIGQQAYITHQIYGREAESGKHKVNLPEPDEDDEPKKKAGGGKKPSSGSTKKSSSGTTSSKKKTPAKKSGAKQNGSGGDSTSSGDRSDRNAEWKKLRAKKQAAAKRTSTTTSSRVTPKGTTSRPSKPKRKR